MLFPNKIDPWQLLEYLRLRNWILGPATGDSRSLFNGRFWRNKPPRQTSHPLVLVAPQTRDYSNYTNAVMQALETLAKEEERSLHEIATDVMAIATKQSPKIVQSSKRGMQLWWHPGKECYYNNEQFVPRDMLFALEAEGAEEWEVLEA